MSEVKLPCPMCGSNNVAFTCNMSYGHGDCGYNNGRIKCNDCSCSIGDFFNYGTPSEAEIQKAWDLWNKRKN